MEIRPPKPGDWFQHHVGSEVLAVRVQFLHAVPESDPPKYLMRTESGKEFDVNAEFIGRLMPLAEGPTIHPSRAVGAAMAVSEPSQRSLIENWLRTMSFGGYAP